MNSMYAMYLIVYLIIYAKKAVSGMLMLIISSSSSSSMQLAGNVTKQNRKKRKDKARTRTEPEQKTQGMYGVCTYAHAEPKAKAESKPNASPLVEEQDNECHNARFFITIAMAVRFKATFPTPITYSHG